MAGELVNHHVPLISRLILLLKQRSRPVSSWFRSTAFLSTFRLIHGVQLRLCGEDILGLSNYFSY